MKEQLDKKRAIKNSIRLYIKTKKWIKPYPKCQSKVRGFKIILFNKMMANLDEYERKVEADIRKLKTRLALVTEARKQNAKRRNWRTLKNFHQSGLCLVEGSCILRKM